MGTILLLDIEHVLFWAINCCHVINIKCFDWLLLCMSYYSLYVYRFWSDCCWPNGHGGSGHGVQLVKFQGRYSIPNVDLTGILCCNFEFSYSVLQWCVVSTKVLKNKTK